MLSISRFLFIYSLLLFTSIAVHAQNNIAGISGRVLNTKNEPLSGSVSIHAVKDSARLQTAILLNGNFQFTGINQQEVLLKLMSMHFRDTFILARYSGEPNIRLADIIIKEIATDLAEVRIAGRLPLVKQSPNGNIEVNVANTILATGNSVNEILSRTPNVLFTEEGQIQVVGKGEAIIYLNGKLITPEQMAVIPTSQIIKIEVIMNPSSRYDAEGKAVINIIIKMKTGEGLMGRIREQVTASAFAGTSTNTFIEGSYGKGKFSLVGNYGLQTGKDRELLHTIRNRPQANEYLNSDIVIDWQRKFKTYKNYGLGAQYNFSDKANISLGYNGDRNRLRGNVISKNAVSTTNRESYFVSNNAADNLRYNHSFTLNFNKLIDSIGSSFFIGSQYSYYNAVVRDIITENSIINDTISDRFLKNNSNQHISISSTQADYTKAFSSSTKLEAGAKFSYVTTDYKTDFLTAESINGDYEPDPGLSNNFRYAEKIAAAYLSYSAMAGKKISYSAGIRGEWTQYNMFTTATNGADISDSYFNFFPNFQVNMTVSDHLKLRASYAARISRPRYQALNPVVIYQDPLTTIEGNPLLIPEKTHAFEIGANYKNYDVKLVYTYTADPFGGGAIRGLAPDSYVLKNFNIYKQHRYALTLSKTGTVKWWSTTNTVTLNYIKEVDNEYDFSFRKPTPHIYLYSGNTFSIKQLFSLQLMGWYLGNRYLGLFYRKGIATVTAGIEKSFFANALKLNFTANDIFHHFIASGDYNVGRTAIYFNRRFTSTYFRGTATYSFGSSKRSAYKNRSTGQSESNRVD